MPPTATEPCRSVCSIQLTVALVGLSLSLLGVLFFSLSLGCNVPVSVGAVEQEVERELATREIKKLEGELLKERHHSEQMELASIAAANGRRDAEEQAAVHFSMVRFSCDVIFCVSYLKLQGRLKRVWHVQEKLRQPDGRGGWHPQANGAADDLQDMRRRLEAEAEKGKDLSQRVLDLEAKLSRNGEDLRLARVALERQSSMREAAELQCKEFSEELTLERQMRAATVAELNKEVKTRVSRPRCWQCTIS